MSDDKKRPCPHIGDEGIPCEGTQELRTDVPFPGALAGVGAGNGTYIDGARRDRISAWVCNLQGRDHFDPA